MTWRLKGERNEIVERFLKFITDQNGEGLIVQRASSNYERGRSLSVLKLKVFNFYNNFNYMFLF